jgi:DNA-binding transcriptional MerR regulator
MAEPGLTAGEVARRLGIAVTTLRSWHQRYGLGPNEHLARRHRRYTDADVSRLEVMRRLTGQGIPAAEAARVALAAERGRSPARPSPQVRAGGGSTIPVGRAGPAARGLAWAAVRLDSPTMTEVIAASVRTDGVARTWDELLRPVLVGVGERHASTKRLVDVEHLLSRTISDAFSGVPRPVAAQPPRVLLACSDDEQHSLPIEALAAALAERGCGTRVLGARVPPQALQAAVRRTGPAAVFVWSHAPATADPAQIMALLAIRPRPVVVAAVGPGWDDGRLPSGVARPAMLTEAVALALESVGTAPVAGGWPSTRSRG